MMPETSLNCNCMKRGDELALHLFFKLQEMDVFRSKPIQNTLQLVPRVGLQHAQF